MLTPFLRQGLERGEKVIYIVDAHTAKTVLGYLQDDGLDVEPYLASGQLSILAVDDAYMREGVFDPDGMITLLQTETERALAEGYLALRVTGEMSWALRGLPGSERLIKYEAKLNEFFPGSNCLAICQYDRRRFDPAVLLDVLHTHPTAVIGAEVYDNFYYIPPTEPLGHDIATAELQQSIQNLAERKRAEEALQRSERKYRNIFENSKDVIYVCDAEGRLLDVNPAVANILGYSKEELAKLDLGENYADPQQRKEFRERLERDGYVDMELRYKHKNGTIKTVHEISVAIKDATGRLSSYQGILRDITEQKKIEQLRSEFVSTVSHELRTPLTSIKGYADLLLAGDAGELNRTQEEFLQVIVRNSDRLTELINDLLDIEKIESGERRFEFRELKLDEILRDVAKTFAVSAEGKGLSFRTKIEDGITVRGSADYLSQAFANLLSNAIKFTKEGSVWLRARSNRGGAIVQVEDTGIGMTEEEQARLFTRFFRADNPYVKEAKGSGLGLSIVKATIDRHGGEITVESELNKGSTFAVILPLSRSWIELEDAGEA